MCCQFVGLPNLLGSLRCQGKQVLASLHGVDHRGMERAEDVLKDYLGLEMVKMSLQSLVENLAEKEPA